ncbi:MAG: phage terminase large subunit family protein, partial [Nitrospirota bacterium]|nr:phage terminase large subunit family protein [Nitrospirota bacterium]
STPKLKYASRIDDDFESSDRAYFYVPCPRCGTFQRLLHTNLVYDEEAPHGAVYACGACAELLREGNKTRMLAQGRWFRRVDDWPDGLKVLDHGDGRWAPRPPDPNKPAGFHIDALYSPVGWFSWGDVATEKEASKRDEARAISFQNTILGLPYEEQSDAPDWKRLHEARLTYRMGLVPASAAVVTAMCDVQRDRLEVGYYAWGPGFEGWLLDHTVIEGDTASDRVWAELTEAAYRRFPTATGGEMDCSMFLIDMGFETEAVKNWVTRMAEPRRVRAVRGEDSFGVTAIIGRSTSDLTVAGKRKRRGFAFWRIAVSSLKLETYRRLRRKRPDGDAVPPWDGPWLHYPQIGEEWFRQLTAERLVREADRHGKKKLAWKVTRPRNEALDLTVGALAGAYMLKMEQWTDDTWRRKAADHGTPPSGKPEEPKTGVVSKAEPKKDRTSIFDRKPTRTSEPYLNR